MKAKFRKTGEIVDIISYSGNADRNDVLDCVSYIDSKGVEHSREKLNFYWDFESIQETSIAPNTDWQQVTNQAAIGAMQVCLGFSGSPSLKSKADALKYAIEFTATGEYPNRTPDIKKAKELYNFICDNVQLPEDNIDSNRLYTQRSLDEILLHANASLNDFLEYTKKDRRKCNPEKPKPSGEVVGEQTKEEAMPLPGSSPLSPVANLLRGVLRDSNFKSISEDTNCNSSKELFQLKRNGEALRVTIVHITNPIE